MWKPFSSFRGRSSLAGLGVFAVLEGIVFILILIAGLVYTWRKGMLEWA